MQFEVSSIEVKVNLTGDTRVTGLTSGLRERTVLGQKAHVRFDVDGQPWRIEITGPYERESGALTAVHTTVLVDAKPSDHYRPAPQWVLDMIEEVRPS